MAISRKPPLTEEAQEKHMIALAMDLAEKQLREGTASSQVITHYLKLASTKERKELEVLETQKKLLDAKAEAITSMKSQEERFKSAIQAFKTYSGQGMDDDEPEY